MIVVKGDPVYKGLRGMKISGYKSSPGVAHVALCINTCVPDQYWQITARTYNPSIECSS